VLLHAVFRQSSPATMVDMKKLRMAMAINMVVESLAMMMVVVKSYGWYGRDELADHP
jgi:hypothetical protein